MFNKGWIERGYRESIFISLGKATKVNLPEGNTRDSPNFPSTITCFPVSNNSKERSLFALMNSLRGFSPEYNTLAKENTSGSERVPPHSTTTLFLILFKILPKTKPGLHAA